MKISYKVSYKKEAVKFLKKYRIEAIKFYKAFETMANDLENFDGYAGDGRTLKQIFTDVPQRVLAVSEPVVDDLIFLGVQDKIIGISACYSKNFAPHETEYAKFARLTYGSGYPSKEAVLGLQPDLIVSWGSLFGESALGSVEYWHNKGIHTYVMTNTVPTRATGRRKVENIVNDLQQLAKIFRLFVVGRFLLDFCQFR